MSKAPWAQTCDKTNAGNIPAKVCQTCFWPRLNCRLSQRASKLMLIYAPPPPPPISGQKALYTRREGWGCIFWGPTRQEFYTPPPFYTPPTPRRVFSGEGGWGCIKFGPAKVRVPLFLGGFVSRVFCLALVALGCIFFFPGLCGLAGLKRRLGGPDLSRDWGGTFLTKWELNPPSPPRKRKWAANPQFEQLTPQNENLILEREELGP